MLVIKHSDYDKQLAKLKNWLVRFPTQAKAATAAGMFAAAQDVMELARSRAPIGPNPSPDHSDGKPGKLREGAYARYNKLMGGQGVSVDMGFEGTFSDRGSPQRYMVVQHENIPPMNHPQGGQPFFLSNAVSDLQGHTTATIAKYVNAWLKSGIILPVTKKVPERGGG